MRNIGGMMLLLGKMIVNNLEMVKVSDLADEIWKSSKLRNKYEEKLESLFRA